ncbi:MAG: SBBP repeat-containing protein, partial [Bacteroidia bacterium]|nr:SBBP repeat-containing protein [Bacteroidia bacterium]
FFAGTSDFDPGAGIVNLTSAGFDDIFILKLDANGNFIWAKQMGGAQYDAAYGMTTDVAGNVYCTGYFKGTADFDPGAATYNLSPGAGLCDAFISKTDSSGNFVWAKQIGGGATTGSVNPFGITLDLGGNVYSTGQFAGQNDFDPGNGTYNLTSTGSGFDIYVSKLDVTGNFVWATKMGGTSIDCGRSLTIDALDNIYLTGRFAGTADFDPGAGTSNLISNGSDDIFVMKLSQSTTGIGPILIIDEPSVIYPNPSSGIFYAEVKTSDETNNIEVYNSLGEKVFSTYVNKTTVAEKITLLDLSDQPAGIYFVTTISSGNRIAKKIILQK